MEAILSANHAQIHEAILEYEETYERSAGDLFQDSLYFDGVGTAVRQVLANPRFQGLTLDSPRRAVLGERIPGVTILRKCRDRAPRAPVRRPISVLGSGDRMAPPYLRT